VFKINYNSTFDPNSGLYHNTVTLTVVSTPQTSTNTASVSGKVWLDQNGDGILGATEPGAAGVAVTLIDTATGNAIRTFTDINGAYNFPTLAAGNYQVRFDPTTNSAYANYRFTTTNADSLAVPATGTTAPIPLAAGQSFTANAGLVNNAAPVGTGGAYTVALNGSLSVSAANSVLAGATDAEGNSITAILVDQPKNGTLTLNADGSFRYVPTAGFVGTDWFSYQPADLYGPGNLAVV
jgi:hypothetical protein